MSVIEQALMTVLANDVATVLKERGQMPGRIRGFVPRTEVVAALAAQGLAITEAELTRVRDFLVDDYRLVVGLWPTGEHWRLKEPV